MRSTKKNRLESAHLYKNWSSEQWKQVILSDKSKFRVSGNDKTPLLVLRKESKRYEGCHTLRSLKFRGCSLMVWPCFGLGVWDLWFLLMVIWIKNHIFDLFLPYYIPWVLELYKNKNKTFTIQEDNAKWWKRSHSINVMEKWPAQSPDPNPIECCVNHIYTAFVLQY